MLLFVYGTLMKNLSNHSYLKYSLYLGECYSLEKYVILIDGSIPYLSTSKNIYNIKGELYDISNDTLKQIDELEDEGNWYKRKELKIVLNEKIMTCYAYFNDQFDHTILLDSDSYHSFLEYKY
jgi:gamma-glutamylaminecyclotransferase